MAPPGTPPPSSRSWISPDSRRPPCNPSRPRRSPALGHRATPAARRAEAGLRGAELLRYLVPGPRTQPEARELGAVGAVDRLALGALRQELSPRDAGAGTSAPAGSPREAVASSGLFNWLLL